MLFELPWSISDMTGRHDLKWLWRQILKCSRWKVKNWLCWMNNIFWVAKFNFRHDIVDMNWSDYGDNYGDKFWSVWDEGNIKIELIASCHIQFPPWQVDISCHRHDNTKNSSWHEENAKKTPDLRFFPPKIAMTWVAITPQTLATWTLKDTKYMSFSA